MSRPAKASASLGLKLEPGGRVRPSDTAGVSSRYSQESPIVHHSPSSLTVAQFGPPSLPVPGILATSLTPDRLVDAHPDSLVLAAFNAARIAAADRSMSSSVVDQLQIEMRIAA